MKAHHFLLSILLLFSLSGVIHAETYTQAMKKAQKGDAYSQSQLGHILANGKGVREDDKAAVKWFRLAAEQGDAYGQSSLAAMYAEESEDRWGCASQAGQAKTEYAAQQIEKTCLVKRGYKPEPKGWFDW